MATLADTITGAVPEAAPAALPVAKAMPRDKPEPGPSRAALVTQWVKDIKAARAHWDKDFKRMRRNMKFAGGLQWPGQTETDDRFMVNLVQRVLKSTVSALYAKNPTVVAERRKTLDFRVWDGKMETLQIAQQAMAAAAQLQEVLPQDITILLEDVKQGAERRAMLDKVGKTLVVLATYYLNESSPGFKLQMKQMVRRARTTGVGYVKLGFQRAMDLSESQTGQLADMANRLAVIGAMTADLQDGETDPNAAEAEKLRLMTASIQAEPEMIVREGLVFGFPHSTRLIPSIGTEKLMGWIGSEWVAEEMMLTPQRVKEVYGVDLGKNFTAYKTVAGAPAAAANRPAGEGKDGMACVWIVYDKTTGLEYILAEGYPDFLKEPAAPPVFIEQFFPYFAITFNDVENEGELFPKSDVELLTHIQREYNRCKESLRQHRIANRPLYVAPNGAFEEAEVKSLSGYAAHAVIQLNALTKGDKADSVLMPVQKIGVDPNLYETEGLFADMQRVTGNSEANLGGTGNGTATESNIAENSRAGGLGLDADDLDEMLSDLMRAASGVMLAELSEDTVRDIAGVGAVWPQLSRSEIAKETWLVVKAGSSGRPNASRDAATLERLYPMLLQIPGISARWLAEKGIRLADDDTDLSDAIIDGMPSMMAQNAMAQPGTGNPASEPTAQGGQGANKTAPGAPGGTSQPAFPGQGAGGTK